jgi:N-acetylglucosamine kinase-like BadF-type ATPase
VARLGAAVVAAAQAGDPYPARMVARWCSRVEGAVRDEVARLDLGPEPVVILFGGLLDASPWLGGRLRDAVRRGAPGARIQGLDCEPVEGAALLALDAWSGDPVRWEFVPRR